MLKILFFFNHFKSFKPGVCISFLTPYIAHYMTFDYWVLKSSEGRNGFKSELDHLTAVASQTGPLTSLSLSHFMLELFWVLNEVMLAMHLAPCLTGTLQKINFRVIYSEGGDEEEGREGGRA